MATQKPISTISYNTPAFLLEKLESWRESHLIQDYMLIRHVGEDGDKDHIHLRIEPNKRLDPMNLSEELREYDPKKPDKPLGVRPWRPSKEEDWILYAVHDREYLMQKYGTCDPKGEKIPYDWHEIEASQYFDVEAAYIRARATLRHSAGSIANRIQEGDMPIKMILEGMDPFRVNAVMRAYEAYDYNNLVNRNIIMEKQLGRLLDAIEVAGFKVSGLDSDDCKIEKV